LGRADVAVDTKVDTRAKISGKTKDNCVEEIMALVITLIPEFFHSSMIASWLDYFQSPNSQLYSRILALVYCHL
jgi:hypothetical protein